MKNHLHRVAAPRTWILDRKTHAFVVRPNAGRHNLSFGLPLGLVIRDVLHVAVTMDEVKKLLTTKTILVDGKRQKDHRFMVGLFDVLSLNQNHYRVLIDTKGRLVVREISAAESSLKPCRGVGKRVISGGKIQIHLHDGQNILLKEKNIHVGDTVVIHLPDAKIKEIFTLSPGSFVFLTKGRHNGDYGHLQEIKGSIALYQKEGAVIETAKDYLFVLGTKTPCIALK